MHINIDSLRHIILDEGNHLTLEHAALVTNNGAQEVQINNDNDAMDDQAIHDGATNAVQTQNQTKEEILNHIAPALRKSTRLRKPAISDDFFVYLNKGDIDIGEPLTYKEAINSLQ